ncbi:DNA alkylation repair protein [Patescibacteria group bacterium]|nr:DNA alkylation repair protein [Patescibacteria group bacterium]MBU4458477.1 DNA alkylation repair protein [Patescibacteria group bacterium]MCG2696330.1 DNA alkylation repair protein [Candidatus Portnoybacteria bacterium]
MAIDDIEREIKKHADPKRAKSSLWFFKTRKGEYGEGDVFLGINNPTARKIAKEFSSLAINDLSKVIKSKFHEERLIALLILVSKFQKTDEENRRKIYNFYLKHTQYINNWDLVDLSAYKIVGAYLEDKDKKILYELAKSKSIWKRRIAILSTFHYIGHGNSREALKIAEILLNDKHDLIHKAVGWMLREIGKCCGEEIEEKFLRKYYKIMPRTMLRYAIERFGEKKRKFYLN